MARIPDQELERIKREVPIAELVRARGIKLKRHGKDLIGLCPFHDDREPSLVVTPSKNLWHCLGACQTGGSVIDWVMQAEGVSFRHAVELLRQHEPSPETDEEPGAPSLELPTLAEPDADDQALLRRVVAFYHKTLKASPDALEYLRSRGLTHPELVDHFQLGFANRTLGYRLPRSDEQASAIRTRLQALGIFRETGHEHFRGCLVIPVIDEEGRITEIYGRRIGTGLRKGSTRHLYLPGPHRGVFNVAALKAYSEVVLTESLIDALTFWSAGYRNVIASYGTEGFTQDHLDAFERYGTKRVLIAYDRDAAGDKAGKSLAERLGKRGVVCYRVPFPKGMDANEYALQVTPADKSLGFSLRHAVWIGLGPLPEGGPTTAAKQGDDEELAILDCLDAAPEEPAPVEVIETQPDDQPDTKAASSSPLAAKQPLASPEPPTPPTDVEAEVTDEQVVIRRGDRRYRVRGLAANTAYGQLKINLLAARGEAFHVDTLDLYSARHRAAFIKAATAELGTTEEVVKRDLGQVLLKLEALVDARIREAATPADKQPVAISANDEAAALELLRDPSLVERILADFETCGVVGEETNKLVGYLACVSRKLEAPLAVIVQSSSAAGKSSLMEAIVALMPPEDVSKYSAMTGQSLFYLGESDLQHTILAIIEEEGAQQASYALKLLQSEGELTIASTGKDPQTGRLVTQEYRVEGPVMILLTTTAIDIDDELLNRCLVLTVDEDREQTRAIHRRQRFGQTLDGLLGRRDRERVESLHHNAQRLLRPLLVVNPYAERLTFLDDKTRTRRDHMKYLTLIRSIALLHQHQRTRRTVTHHGQRLEYIEVAPSDIELANRLAHEVLGRSLDELPPQTRRLLGLIDEMVMAACQRLAMDRPDYRFTRRDVRKHTGFGHTQLKIHLKRLEEMEYLIVHQGGRGQRFVYELAYDGEGQDGQRFLPRLIDVDALDPSAEYLANRSGASGHRSGPGRGQVGPTSGPGRTDNNGREARKDLAPSSDGPSGRDNGLLPGAANGHDRTVHSPVVAQAAGRDGR